MVSIADELRDYACHRIDVTRDPPLAIADRIDAAHRSALEKLAAQLDESEDGWVRLPVDADGVPIRVGDVLTHGTVACIRLTTKGWEIVVGYNGGSGVFNPSAMHHRTPTVEDVLREFADKVCSSDHIVKDGRYSGLEDTDLLAEYAVKLRLAGEDE